MQVKACLALRAGSNRLRESRQSLKVDRVNKFHSGALVVYRTRGDALDGRTSGKGGLILSPPSVPEQGKNKVPVNSVCFNPFK